MCTNNIPKTVGRVANRIAGGKFEVDGKEYTIAKNDGGVHSLHGGKIGFDKQIWESKILRSGVEFTLRSADGDEGYPGPFSFVLQCHDRPLGPDLRVRWHQGRWSRLCGTS